MHLLLNCFWNLCNETLAPGIVSEIRASAVNSTTIDVTEWMVVEQAKCAISYDACITITSAGVSDIDLNRTQQQAAACKSNIIASTASYVLKST